MHAVLALSGSHYICRNSAATEIRQSTWQHYALVISSLRGEIQRLGRKSPEESLRLLATLMVLCHIEVLSGESQGGVFAHLRASRQLILELLQGPAQCKNEEDQDLRGFVLETYAYLVLVANITPYGIVEGRTLPFDDFVTSLESLQQYKTFGTFMGCGYSLFEKIADVSRFSTRRLHEEKSGGVSQESLDTYEALLSSITSWEPTDSGPDASSWEAYRAIAGEVYKHALLIYLKASMCGTVVDNPKVICDIQQYIDICLGLLLKLDRSPFSTIMMWPLMIVGSCLIRVDQRLDLRERCQNSSFQMTHVSKAADLLQLVWEDPDKRSYGPYGLQLAMEKHGINFGMA
ncbi:hypothetical protein GQ53DRAFT_633146 [Thozetella sp. PMI_491]|nr:hypothetical protein GQ53DRAFT_633146 [Thozetella sp. PMI_491]